MTKGYGGNLEFIKNRDGATIGLKRDGEVLEPGQLSHTEMDVLAAERHGRGPRAYSGEERAHLAELLGEKQKESGN